MAQVLMTLIAPELHRAQPLVVRHAQVIGLLVAMTLRHPDNAEDAVAEGCVDLILKVRW